MRSERRARRWAVAATVLRGVAMVGVATVVFPPPPTFAAAIPAGSDSAAASGDEWGRFRWRQELLDPPADRTLFRIAIPPEVYDGSAAPPSDLRILGAKGKAWPHYAWVPGQMPATTEATGTIVNRYTIDRHPPRRVAEVDAGAGRGPRSRVRVETSGHDFLRRVEVFGSEDRREWARLGEGWLVDHAQPPSVRNDVIRFPESDFRYLKLVVWPTAHDTRDLPEVSRVSVFRALHEDDGDWQEIRLTERPAEEASGPDLAIHVFDAGAAHLPLARLSFEVDDAEFARGIRVWGRDRPEDEWTFVAGGEIHRYGGEENLFLSMRTFHYRFARVDELHEDDDPLTITGAVGHQRIMYLVAESRGDAPAYLVYGATPPAEGPRFDLRDRTGVKAAAAAPIVRLGPREPNDRHRDFPGKWMPWIAGAAIALVSLIVVWVIAGMVRRAGAAGPE